MKIFIEPRITSADVRNVWSAAEPIPGYYLIFAFLPRRPVADYRLLKFRPTKSKKDALRFFISKWKDNDIAYGIG